MKKITLIAQTFASATLATMVACSSSNTGTAAQLPAVSADKLGQVCTGFGTSPGDTATFKDDADCKAGYCLVDLTGNDIVSYCTADCDVYSCPNGYVCKAVTLGDTKHACFIDPNATVADAGTCQQPSGAYTSHGTPRDTTNCPAVQDSTITFDVNDAGTGCTQSFDQNSCTLTRHCSETDSSGTATTDWTVTVPLGGSNLTGTITIDATSSSGTLDCVYDETFAKQ